MLRKAERRRPLTMSASVNGRHALLSSRLRKHRPVRTRRRLKLRPRQRLRPPRSEPTPPAVPRQALCPSGATTGRGRQGAGLAEGRGGWIQGYNGPMAVDGDQQVIVAVGVSNQARDNPICCPCWSGSSPTPASRRTRCSRIPATAAPTPSRCAVGWTVSCCGEPITRSGS